MPTLELVLPPPSLDVINGSPQVGRRHLHHHTSSLSRQQLEDQRGERERAEMEGRALHSHFITRFLELSQLTQPLHFTVVLRGGRRGSPLLPPSPQPPRSGRPTRAPRFCSRIKSCFFEGLRLGGPGGKSCCAIHDARNEKPRGRRISTMWIRNIVVADSFGMLFASVGTCLLSRLI